MNLHHCKRASAALTHFTCEEDIAIVLIQEPWIVRGRVAGLGETKGKIVYDRNLDSPRTCILGKM